MRIVIIGASGNVGTALLRRLAREDGHEVVGVSRNPPEDLSGTYGTAQWHALDIGAEEDTEALRAVVRGADAVVHAAWLIQPSRDPAELGRVNLGGTRRLVAAVLAEGVPHLVHLSSVGAYAPHPTDDSVVDESWPTRGIGASRYSHEKAVLEAELDVVERDNPGLVVSRVRPALVFQHDAGSEIARYFVGALAPVRFVRSVHLPALPLPWGLRFQVVHADDLADAITRIVERTAPGAFNVADEPVLGGRDLARALGAARPVGISRHLARALVAATYRARVHPVHEGWLDLGLGVPRMSTGRARRELGWAPAHAAFDVLAELLDGMRSHAGTESPVLRSRRAVKDRTGP